MLVPCRCHVRHALITAAAAHALCCLLRLGADCAPGSAFNASSWCSACQSGKFCPGGDAKVNPSNAALDCPAGLETRFAGAKSQAQCFTKPGFGRLTGRHARGNVVFSSVRCRIGTYNVGGNTASCQAWCVRDGASQHVAPAPVHANTTMLWLKHCAAAAATAPNPKPIAARA